MDLIQPQTKGLLHCTTSAIEFNYNITFEINGNIIDVNIHWIYLFFTV